MSGVRETLYDFCQRTAKQKLLCQWDFRRNGKLTPRDVSFGSKVKAWWLCEKGHSWQDSIVSRTLDGAGCPVCAGKVIVAGENDLECVCENLGVEVAYAFQDLNDGPGKVLEGRTKPWGTRQAVPAAKDIIHEPFAVINADDYYGKKLFVNYMIGLSLIT